MINRKYIRKSAKNIKLCPSTLESSTSSFSRSSSFFNCAISRESAAIFSSACGSVGHNRDGGGGSRADKKKPVRAWCLSSRNSPSARRSCCWLAPAWPAAAPPETGMTHVDVTSDECRVGRELISMPLHLPDSSVAIFRNCRHALRPCCNLNNRIRERSLADAHALVLEQAPAGVHMTCARLHAGAPASCPRSPTSPASVSLPSPAQAVATAATSQRRTNKTRENTTNRMLQYRYIITNKCKSAPTTCTLSSCCSSNFDFKSSLSAVTAASCCCASSSLPSTSHLNRVTSAIVAFASARAVRQT